MRRGKLMRSRGNIHGELLCNATGPILVQQLCGEGGRSISESMVKHTKWDRLSATRTEGKNSEYFKIRSGRNSRSLIVIAVIGCKCEEQKEEEARKDRTS